MATALRNRVGRKHEPGSDPAHTAHERTDSPGVQASGQLDAAPAGPSSLAFPLRLWQMNGTAHSAADAAEEDDKETPMQTAATARGTVHFDEPPTQVPDDVVSGADVSSPFRERQASFLGKLKFLTSSPPSGHNRNSSSGIGTRNNMPTSHRATLTDITDSATHSAVASPASERDEPSYPVEAAETDAEADEEPDNEDGALEARDKGRRKARRPGMRSAETTPSAPRMQRFESRFASFIREQTHHRDASSASRPGVSRRNTTSDVGEEDEEARGGGVSEDEGRDRIRTAWRRRLESARGLSYPARKPPTETEPTSNDDAPKRPGHFRRLTGMGFGGDSASPASPFRAKHDRQASTSAQKWRQVKAGLKMLGQRKKDERTRVDHQKSAQLMAELLAGAPAALVFASMFQRDEHGHRKLPVLLEQLKIAVSESTVREDKRGDRHLVFRIDLEYGNGAAKMKWSIQRTLKDFVNLHVKYQSAAAADKVRHLRSEHKSKAKMPKFPRSAFPYARTIRGLFDNLQEDEDEDEVPENRFDLIGPATPGLSELPAPSTSSTHANTDAANGANGRPAGLHKRRKSSFAPNRLRRSSTGDLAAPPADPNELTARQREVYAARQRRKLEAYLQGMIRWLIFRPDSTRLCKFLELSAIAIRLSVEGGYQGKQGLLTISSRRKGEMGRNMLGPQGFADRHRPRWFLVRHSYIACVDSPESLNIYDVFLVDSDFSTEKRKKRAATQKSAGDVAKAVGDATKTKHLLLRLYNAERKLRLLARTDRQLTQFQESINLMAQATVWSKKQRFGSFAPVRDNVWCRWLVDGRDHMWQVSRAIDMAKDFIYIHDWWLSPELYMRRPAAISQEWRLDRLLLRKARQGVKIFVIVYRNIESAIPIDSEYTKWSLLDLDPNVMVQRSPNQFRQNQFFWAHHEKLVVVDNMMAFVGGVDLCFGRWDDPCHSLTDDKLTGFEPGFPGRKDTDSCQVWPGKDYSNPRVQDFYGLERPYEEMYDRTRVPRMPWHDISMQIVGQPARDVARHFVQRWNYILRNRVPSRPTPVLLPPPEYEHGELERVGMTGTCQIQILRSCSPWSIGTPNKVEHSIMNAYVHLIEQSEHFVYIENQFYISSCTVEGTTIHNKIGDALVERAIRASENGEKWHACLVIPLMPGFQNSVDSQDGTSIRLIMQCQYRSICRGETSIFGRLRAAGLEPEDYIRFYSLRQWGKIGPRKCLTTEQLYIHAKIMVVDDRHVIIGSANINERSMLGSRDSEVAAVVTDTKMLPSFMGGEPYDVGEFPHTLRKRLMREHLGIDVDVIYRRDELAREREMQDREMNRIYGEPPRPAHDSATPPSTPPSTTPPETKTSEQHLSTDSSNLLAGSTNAGSALSLDQPPPAHEKHKRHSADLQRDLDVEGQGQDNMKAFVEAGDYGFATSYVDSRGREVLVKKNAAVGQRIQNLEFDMTHPDPRPPSREEDHVSVRPPWPTDRTDTYALGLPTRSQLPELPAVDDTDIGGPPLTRGLSSTSTKIVNPLVNSLRRPEIHEDCMRDPIAATFYHDIWNKVAENNTKLYRAVFHCMPDSEVVDWKTYERFNDCNERFMQAQGLGSSKPRPAKDAPGQSGPPGSGGPEASPAAAEKMVQSRARSKSVVSTLAAKLRNRRPTVDGSTHTQEEEVKEKANSHDHPEHGDDLSGSPRTAVLDEKDALASEQQQQQQQQQAEAPNEKDASADSGASNGVNGLVHAAVSRQRTIQYSDKIDHAPETTATQSTPTAPAAAGGGLQHSTSQKRRRRANTRTSARAPLDDVLGRDEAEDLLKLVQGHLVLWPYDWLEKEERGGNWLYNIDQLAPLEIYD